MSEIRPLNGVNLRQPAHLIPPNQWAGMQNMDMKSNQMFQQIDGSVRFHGSTIGTNAPTGIFINYDTENDKEDILVAVDGTIKKKNLGANEFEDLKSGLTPNELRFGVGLRNKTYFAHPSDGLLEYDGISKIRTVNTIKLKDIIFDKSTNRAFGVLADIPNAIVWTNDVVNTGGVPLTWPGQNVSTFPQTEGDVIEKLFMLDGRLVIFMTNSIWIQFINGAPTNWRPQQVATSVGCIAPKTVRIVGKEIWFLGYSPASGRGVYAYADGRVRLLSYDITPFLERINDLKIQDAVADHIDDIYKISFAIDRSSENNFTFHFDTINTNPDTGSPNIYGPHTYGFNASAVLNTRKFKGQHLFASKYTDGARIFEVRKEYQTQHSSELSDDGDLIQPILLSRIIDREQIGRDIFDETWFKRYENIYSELPPVGTWSALVEILKGYEHETFDSFDQFLEGENLSGDALDLGSEPVDFESLSIEPRLEDILSDSIQLKISMSIANQKLSYRGLFYTARPVRRKKVAQNVAI